MAQLKTGGLRPRVMSLVMVLSCWMGLANAQTTEVPDPKAWAAMGAGEQAQKQKEIRQQLRNASPQDREAFRAKLREKLQTLSPQERAELADKARARWKAMTPQEREQFKAHRAEKLKALPPAEREDLVAQRRAMLEKLSPEERAALREKLPTR